MNEIINNIKTRRSIKKYKNEPVPKELLDIIAEAGTYAPSGLNKQSPIIIEVTDKKMRDRISQINASIAGMPENFDPFYNAPAILIVLANKNIPTYIYDGSLVMENMMLASHSLGLGSCWIHRAKETFETEEGKKILKKLGITEDYEGIANCIIGYPDIEPTPKPRKDNYIYKI